MAIAPGNRVELVATDDPYTNLQPGDRGTVTGQPPAPGVRRDDPRATAAEPACAQRGTGGN